MITPQTSDVHDVGEAERGVEYFDANFSCFHFWEGEGVFDHGGFFGGEDPRHCVCFFDVGLEVERVINLFH